MSKNSDWNIGKLSKKSHILYDLIYSATDNSLTEEDEELNKKIYCEILRTPDSPKTATKIINKVINKSLTNRSHQSIWYCLLLLDGAAKNTDAKFCAAILTKEFLGDLVRIVESKYSVPDFVKDKLLYIMKDWHSSLCGVHGYPNLVKYYKNINYPFGTVLCQNEAPKLIQHVYPANKTTSPNVLQHPVLSTSNLSAKDKIVHDIDIIEINLTVFSDCISSLNPETATAEEMKFLEELYETGLKMQKRIDEVIPYITWEDIICQLIQVNDKILNTADRYKRFMRTKSMLTLSPTGTSAKKQILPEIYDAPNFSNQATNSPLPEIYDVTNFKTAPKRDLYEIYATGSLPTYSEAVTIKNEHNNKDKDQNLISFDEEPLSYSYKNIPLPSLPTSNGSDPNSVPENVNTTGGLSSNEFDEFIELIARREQTHSLEPLDEVYAPPLYDEAALQTDRSKR